MKTSRRILLAIILTSMFAMMDCVEFGYAAYVTHFNIRALDLKGEDAQNFRDAFDQQLWHSISSFIIVLCQLGILLWLRRSKSCEEGRELTE